MKVEEIEQIIGKYVTYAHVVDEWGMNGHYTIKGIQEAAIAIAQAADREKLTKEEHELLGLAVDFAIMGGLAAGMSELEREELFSNLRTIASKLSLPQPPK